MTSQQQIAREAWANIIKRNQASSDRSDADYIAIILSAIERATKELAEVADRISAENLELRRAAQPQPSKVSPLGERSEQQEWTPERIRSYFDNTLSDYEGSKRLSRDINAAIAAAWKEHDDVADALANFSETIKQLGSKNQQLNAELDSERKKFTYMLDEKETWLAAERTERCEVCNSELSQCGPQGVDGEPSMDCLVCKLREQLAAERQRRPAVTVEMFVEERRLHGITKQSLEDTRDLLQSEVRKPLVEALLDAGCRLRELTRSYEERWGKNHTKDFHNLIQRIDALAKEDKIYD